LQFFWKKKKIKEFIKNSKIKKKLHGQAIIGSLTLLVQFYRMTVFVDYWNFWPGWVSGGKVWRHGIQYMWKRRNNVPGSNNPPSQMSIKTWSPMQWTAWFPRQKERAYTKYKKLINKFNFFELTGNMKQMQTKALIQ